MLLVFRSGDWAGWVFQQLLSSPDNFYSAVKNAWNHSLVAKWSYSLVSQREWMSSSEWYPCCLRMAYIADCPLFHCQRIPWLPRFHLQASPMVLGRHLSSCHELCVWVLFFIFFTGTKIPQTSTHQSTSLGSSHLTLSCFCILTQCIVIAIMLLSWLDLVAACLWISLFKEILNFLAIFRTEYPAFMKTSITEEGH